MSLARNANATKELFRIAIEESTEEEKITMMPLLIAMRDDLKETLLNKKQVPVYVDDRDIMRNTKNKIAASLTDPKFRPKTIPDKKKAANKKKARGKVDIDNG